MSHHYDLRKRRSDSDNNIPRKILKWYGEISHEEFHDALRNFSDVKLKNYLSALRNFKLCYKNRNENCYILAQNRGNREFLTILLEYDSSGVNAANSDGETLLMRDIFVFNCRHFQQLIDKRANVNNCSSKGHTALHYATSETNTPIYVIRKLIELNADVNAIDIVKGNTPLLHLCSNTDYYVMFEKIKLLVESGADVNLPNSYHLTPLMATASIHVGYSPDIRIIKYLIENGARGDSLTDSNVTALDYLIYGLFRYSETLSNEKWRILVNEYFVPAVDLLLEAGAGKFMFMKNKYSSTFLRLAFGTYIHHGCTWYIREILLHLVKAAFKKLQEGITFEENHVHPLVCILQKMHQGDNIFIENLADLLIKHPTNEFKNFPKQVEINTEVFSWECLGRKNTFDCFVSVVGSFVRGVPLSSIKFWLMQFRENNFDFSNEYPLLVILLLRFIQEDTPTTPDGLLEIVEFLLDTENPICSNEFEFYDGALVTLQTIFDVPDCIWISAVFGNVKLLNKLLPYWNQQPVAICLFLRPWLETEQNLRKLMLNSIHTILPYLIKIGGPAPHGSILYKLLGKYTEELADSMRLHTTNEEEIIYRNVLIMLHNMTKNPASLKILSRTVVRANATNYGNNLPYYLESLVPPGLTTFTTLKFNIIE